MEVSGNKELGCERLAGAQHFAIDEVSEQNSPDPLMIPSSHRFQTLMAEVRGHSHMQHCSHIALCNGHMDCCTIAQCI